MGLARRGTPWPWLVAGAIIALHFHDLLRPHAALFFKTDGRRLCLWFALGASVALLEPGLMRHLAHWLPAFLGAGLYVAACHLGWAAVVGPIVLLPAFLWLMWSVPVPHFEARVGGDYSYGLYIYGFPVQQALASLGFHNHLGLYIASSFLLTLTLAIASWHAVEKRALKLKNVGASPAPSHLS